MHEVGPGTLIADRYAVSHRLQQHPRWERWAAHDTTLGRDVVILTFAGGTPAAAAAVDAARRAAAVTEPRLVRVLDIVTPPSSGQSPGAGAGTHDVAELCAIVEEPVERSRSLTRILEQGGLPADEARRITGEAAKALDAAAARGLRHIVLTPRNVLLLPDGSVRVRGVAVEAALLGLEDTPAAVGARLDATALVGIGYAALTGRWPLSGADAGLPRAPIVGGSVVAADELGADACLDLDRLARAAFVEHAGPGNAAEVLAGLHPWPNGPTIDLWGDRRPSADSGAGVPSRGASTVGGGSAAGQGYGSALGDAGGGTLGSPGRGPDLTAAQGVSADPGAMADGTSGGRSGPTSGRAADEDRGGTSGAVRGGSAAATAASVSAAVSKGARGVGSALGSAGTAAAKAASRLGERARHTVDRLSTRPEPVAGDAPAAAGFPGQTTPASTAPGSTTPASTTPASTTPAAPATATSSAPGTARPTGAQPSRAGSTAGGRPQAAAQRAAAPRAAAPRTLRAPDTIREDATLASVLTPVDSPLEDAVPLVPITGEFGRDESRLALAIVAGLVVLLAVLGMWGLPKLTSVGLPSAPGTTAGATSKATGTAQPGSPAATGAAPAGALTPVAIIGAATFDASAGQVASSSAPKGYDGDAATMWRSKWYSNDKFGGLKVPGIGYVVDLGQQTEVRRVTVTVPVAQDITVYVANRASLDGATSIGSSAGKSGELVFDAPAGPIASGQLVIVLVTKLGPDGSGKFRAQVSEMAVSR